MFQAVLDGLLLVLEWPAIGYLFLGVLLGMFFGAVPGLSGLVGMAILRPCTFGLGPGAAFGFLLGMYAVTTTADTLASVLRADPEWDSLPEATPAGLLRLMRRCLVKDARDRVRHAGRGDPARRAGR